MRWLVALALVGSLTANRPRPVEAASPTFERVGQTEHVTYYAAEGQKVDIGRTEAFLTQLRSLLGPPPEGWRLEYYRHPSRADLREHTGLGAIGVTDLDASRVDSVREFHPHELVHAAAGPLGRPPVFFAEGLAIALTAGGRWAGRDIDAIAREELERQPSLEPFLAAFAEQDPVAAYALAGSFTTFLLDQYGVEAVVAFFRNCGTSATGYERAFRRAFGRTVAGVTNAWQQAVRAGNREVARSWHDPQGWPGALQRQPDVLIAAAAPTD